MAPFSKRRRLSRKSHVQRTELHDRSRMGVFPFMMLPPELRHQTYETAIAVHEGELGGVFGFHQAPKLETSARRAVKVSNDLLRTCKTVYREYMPILLREPIIDMDICIDGIKISGQLWTIPSLAERLSAAPSINGQPYQESVFSSDPKHKLKDMNSLGKLWSTAVPERNVSHLHAWVRCTKLKDILQLRYTLELLVQVLDIHCSHASIIRFTPIIQNIMQYKIVRELCQLTVKHNNGHSTSLCTRAPRTLTNALFHSGPFTYESIRSISAECSVTEVGQRKNSVWEHHEFLQDNSSWRIAKTQRHFSGGRPEPKN